VTPGNLYFIVFILRFVALYIPLVLFIHLTTHTEIMYGMEDVLSPLSRLRVPVRDIALVTGIVFRFIPLLYGEAARITTARIIRGAGAARKKGIFATLSSMASLFVPLMLRTLTRAERLAQAITARYYGTGKNSRYLLWKTKKGQRILILSVMLLSGILVYLSVKIRI
jgi:energy-coupling factor transporter transmembrane protein EcfT